jgi:hypothetical protein
MVSILEVPGVFVNENAAQKVYREIVLLKALPPHRNIIKLIKVAVSANRRDICITYE